MWPLVALGAAAWYLSRPRRNPDWITDKQGRHHPIRGTIKDGVAYDEVLAGDTVPRPRGRDDLYGDAVRTTRAKNLLVKKLDLTPTQERRVKAYLTRISELQRDKYGKRFDALRDQYAALESERQAELATLPRGTSSVAPAYRRIDAKWNEKLRAVEEKNQALGLEVRNDPEVAAMFADPAMQRYERRELYRRYGDRMLEEFKKQGVI